MMKLLGPNIEEVVNAGEDLFGRDAFGQGLLSLFKRSADPLVVALDEPWGAGKTVFAKRLQRAAASDGFKVVYFDAFKKDYEPDVFVSLAAEILSTFVAKPKQGKALKDRAKDVAKIGLRVAFKGAVRAATAGVITSSDLLDANVAMAGDVGDILEAELDQIIDARLSSSAKEAASFEAFRKELAEIAASDAKPLLFIVDELDRCKPTYALSVIETIKHLFLVKNVHFLLVCQLRQMGAAAQKMYGSEIDSGLYLEKFIDVKVSFPVHDENNRKRQISKFVERIVERLPADLDDGGTYRSMMDFLAEISFRRNYSLRRIERILTQFALCMAFSNPRRDRLAPVICVLCDLKHSNPALFEKAKRGVLSFDEIQNFYNFNDTFEWYVGWLRYIFDASIDRYHEDWRSYSRDYRISDQRTASMHLANNVVDRITA